MATQNKYDDMSVLDALTYIKNGHLLLPDIQRKYVWNYQQIEDLFDSIVDGFPVGTCIMWKTTRAVLNEKKPNLYYFLRDFQKEKSKNEQAPESFKDEADYYIILDGQQRLTSLNIALYGSYTDYKGGKGRSRSDPNNWVKRELYYNLDFYNDLEEQDDENPLKRFAFLKADDANNGNWYKIKQILEFDALDNYIESLINKGYRKEIRADLSTLFKRLEASSEGGLIHYYCIMKDDYDDVLDIFVRVNSTGEKLSKSDLLFSTLIDGWKEGREEIDTLIESMNANNGFSFNRDYLMRLAMILVDESAKLKIQTLTRKTVVKIREQWQKIKKTASDMVAMLVSIGLSKESITSYNATMPIAYYLFKGGKLKTKNAQKEVRKFLTVAMAKRLFGVSSDAALNSSRNALKNIDCTTSPFKLSLFSDVVLTGGRTFKVSEEELDFWLNNYQKGQSTYVLLALLYPHLKLNQVSFHQDHCHPYNAFENKNIKSLDISEEKIAEWQKKRNLLPNLQFLEGGENESKNCASLIDWCAGGNDFAYHPDNISLELADFDEFFEARRKLMKEKLLQILDLTADNSNEFDEDGECEIQDDVDTSVSDVIPLAEKCSEFIREKEKTGEINEGPSFDFHNKDGDFVQVRRYTSPAIEEVIPCVPGFESTWGTQYFWYFEFVFVGAKVVAQFVVSCLNSPDATFEIFQKINKNDSGFHYAGRLTHERELGFPLKFPSINLDGKTDDEIKATFEDLYKQLKDFERRLISYLSEGE